MEIASRSDAVGAASQGAHAAGQAWARGAGEPYAALAETHSAVVFFLGGLAYKLKKPVALGFLDFSTPQARAAACHREIELNRRFAPGVYLGVAEIGDPLARSVTIWW